MTVMVLGSQGDAVEIISEGQTLYLSGDFDGRSTMEVRTAIYDRLAGAEQDLVIDLSEVRAVDVTALKVLAAASHWAVGHGRHVTLRGCGPAVRRLLHLSHLIRAVEIERGAATA